MPSLATGVLLALGLTTAAASQPQPPPLLMADDAHQPHITVSWPTRAGHVEKLEGDRAWRSPADASPLGVNISAFAALGGVRLDKGGGHPHGAVVGITLAKLDWSKPFFDDIQPGGDITIRFDHIVMNQPAAPLPNTGLVQLKYKIDDLKACELDAIYKNLVLFSDPHDPLSEALAPNTFALGALDGAPGRGHFSATTAADHSTSITLTLPYTQLRHFKDPYQRSTPGGFFEPTAIHVEMEVVAERSSLPSASSPHH